jgi:hypothetical protein
MRAALAVIAALVVTATASAWPGRPAAAPPKPAEPAGPPPAWVEAATRSVWLSYSGYCWRTSCADYLPPTQRPDLARLVLEPGQTVRIHLGFKPTRLSVRRLPANAVATLRPAAVASWRPARAGVAVVEAKGAAGSASYAVQIVVRG